MARAPDPLLGRQHVLGDPVLDSGYSAIATCWAQAVTCERMQFPLIIARLNKLLRSLHENEHVLVEKAGVNLCSCHEDEHDTLLAVCREARETERRNWRRAQALLRNRFRRLFREHVICMDAISVLQARMSGPMSQAR